MQMTFPDEYLPAAAEAASLDELNRTSSPKKCWNGHTISQWHTSLDAKEETVTAF